MASLHQQFTASVVCVKSMVILPQAEAVRSGVPKTNGLWVNPILFQYVTLLLGPQLLPQLQTH